MAWCSLVWVCQNTDYVAPTSLSKCQTVCSAAIDDNGVHPCRNLFICCFYHCPAIQGLSGSCLADMAMATPEHLTSATTTQHHCLEQHLWTDGSTFESHLPVPNHLSQHYTTHKPTQHTTAATACKPLQLELPRHPVSSGWNNPEHLSPGNCSQEACLPGNLSSSRSSTAAVPLVAILASYTPEHVTMQPACVTQRV